MKVAFRAPELLADGSLAEADYGFEGARDTGLEITRNGRPQLTLGPGYQALRTLACGVCSTGTTCPSRSPR